MADQNNKQQESPEQEQTNEEKVERDPSELEEESSGSAQKVELDLDDAPFLEEDEEEEEKEQEKKSKQKGEEAEGEEKEEAQHIAWWKRKWVIASASALLLLLLFFLIWLFLFAPGESVPEKKTTPKSTKEAPSKAKEPSEPEQVNVKFEPFQVEYMQDGEIQFLFCKFAFSTNDVLQWEIKRKTMVLRDAIYYYLKNKDLTFLNNKDNVQQLKTDLLSVVNQFLSNGNIKEILIQEYRVE